MYSAVNTFVTHMNYTPTTPLIPATWARLRLRSADSRQYSPAPGSTPRPAPLARAPPLSLPQRGPPLWPTPCMKSLPPCLRSLTLRYWKYCHAAALHADRPSGTAPAFARPPGGRERGEGGAAAPANYLNRSVHTGTHSTTIHHFTPSARASIDSCRPPMIGHD